MIDLLSHNFFVFPSHLTNMLYVGMSTKKFLTSQLMPCQNTYNSKLVLSSGYLRPSKTVHEIHPNVTKTDHTHDLDAVRHETVTHHGQTFEAILFQHPSFPGLVHAVRCYIHVTKEGHHSLRMQTLMQFTIFC